MITKSEILAYVILFLGVSLLVFTFFNAWQFLMGVLEFPDLGNIEEIFGEVLAPLIETCIRIMYLGIMGWIGSTITMRGITVLLQVTPETKPKTPKKTKTKAEPKKLEEAWEKALQESKLEMKSAENR